ncbi:carbohydrate ABC transporter permease [Nonomuraea sp. MTCD27]|uniref:carbohydrate ABC transporter permease n=1 Tax=Nonomuraea sp. MTCD27 TaxID=1676747 RepID=UPI0035C12BC8
MTDLSARPATAPAARRRHLNERRREALFGYLFTLPQLLGFLAFVIGPMIAVIWFSMTDYQALTGQSTFVGLDNLKHLAEDPKLPGVLRTTILFVALYVPAGLALGLVLAVAVNQKIPGIKWFRAVYFMPTLVSIAAWTIVWQFMLVPNGLINEFLRMLDIHGPVWLRDPDLALAAVIGVQLIKGAGLNMLIFVAALQGVPKELVEAARLDGAGRWTIARRVTLPMISPEILMVFILMTIGAFKTFQQVLLLTEGGPGTSTTVLAYYVYEQAFKFNDFGYASALALLLFLILLLITALTWQLRKRVVFHESA